MKKIDKADIMENTPKVAIIPIILSIILFMTDSLVGGIVCLALGGIIAVGGLLLAADTFKQVVSRIMGTLGIILIGVGIGVRIVSSSSSYGIAAIVIGIILFIWALRRIALGNESTLKSAIVLALTVMLFVVLIIGSVNTLLGRSGNYGNSGNSELICNNCGGDGWDSANGGSCVWCGGDGRTSWNP